MSFASIPFLYRFLPGTLLVYALTPRRFKNAALLAASLVFYFFGEPQYTVLLIISSLSDYLHSLYIEPRRGSRAAKAALVSSIVINLGLLGFFKYADFLISAVNSLTGMKIPLVNVTLPIGISFYTFQTMSYTIDVYLGNLKARRDFTGFATFVCLFPQLIAGPIVRYSEIERDLDSRRSGLADVAYGVRRLTLGLAKKVIIANTMGEVCAAFRAADEKTVLFHWLYAAAYVFQIYFDFSGYSDMAIGLGRMFGFKFPENFNYPYMSRSVSEFWRRWHMTLGAWFRDYVYIPMGGNRVKKMRWLLNLMTVWALTGLWHGAAWTYVAWGLFFGVLLIIEKFWLGRVLKRCGKILPHVYVLSAVILSFVLFNANGFSEALSDIGGLFAFASLPAADFASLYCLRSYAVMFAVAAVGSTPAVKLLLQRLSGTKSGGRLVAVLEPAALGLALLAVTAYLVDGSFNPFLYFRF